MSRADSAPVEQLREQGWLVLPGLLSTREVERYRELLRPILDGHPCGRIPFEGERTRRVYALLAKCPETAALVEHPRLLALCDAFLTPGYLLSTIQAIDIQPGEIAQDLHCDDDGGAPARPREPMGLSTVWALDDFTLENGSTRIVPGSHRWDGQGSAGQPVSVEMEAGSVLVYLGGTLHGGGANRSAAARLAISIIYCEPWLRQFENQVLVIPPRAATRYSTRIQRMLGYSQLGPFGTADGRDPIRLVEQAAREMEDA